jgi:putative ATPase
VYTLKPLEKDQLIFLIDKALREDEWLRSRNISVGEYDAMLRWSGGDARKLLNVLELVAQHIEGEPISNEKVMQIVQENPAMYDKNGEMHYDVVSAFIKSMRGSDPNAAVYYLARMVEGGEDPKFIARRMLILASEDIGLANPNALLIADATFRAIQNIGWPEARIILSQCAIYLATSPKSNSAYMAIDDALATVRRTGNLPIPLNLRNAPTKLMKELGYGDNYQYAHAYDGNFVNAEFLPEEIKGQIFYSPGKNAKEAAVKDWLKARWGNKYEG